MSKGDKEVFRCDSCPWTGTLEESNYGVEEVQEYYGAYTWRFPYAKCPECGEDLELSLKELELFLATNAQIEEE